MKVSRRFNRASLRGRPRSIPPASVRLNCYNKSLLGTITDAGVESTMTQMKSFGPKKRMERNRNASKRCIKIITVDREV